MTDVLKGVFLEMMSAKFGAKKIATYLLTKIGGLQGGDIKQGVPTMEKWHSKLFL